MRRQRKRLENRSDLRKVFREIITFHKPEYFPHFEAWGFWNETIDRWHKEGLPLDKTPWEFFELDQFMSNAPEELSYYTPNRITQIPYWPPFGYKLIEETGSYVVQRESDRIIKKQLKDKTSMPQFLDFPVKSRKDWENLKWRLDPHIKDRYKGVKEISVSFNNRSTIVPFVICGGYGFPRNLFGEVNLAYIYYDDPELVHEIMEHWVYFYTGIADNLCPLIDFDYVYLWEDMAYKTSSLISPRLFSEFILPYYKVLIAYLKKRYRLDIFLVDSDGNNFPLLPLFIEAGINIFIPCEINAGMEPLLIREKFPNLALLGGINKQVLSRGKEEIKKEILGKVPKMLESGGYFPSVDHLIPADVPFENFCYYMEILREIEK
jgi:uroporphyrinogen decarboxylase